MVEKILRSQHQTVDAINFVHELIHSPCTKYALLHATDGKLRKVIYRKTRRRKAHTGKVRSLAAAESELSMAATIVSTTVL